MNETLRTAVYSRAASDNPHLPVAAQQALAEKLLSLSPELLPNLSEWACGLPLSDIPVRGKYTVRAVLAVRNDRDIPSALLALDAYAKDPSQEFRVWRMKL